MICFAWINRELIFKLEHFEKNENITCDVVHIKFIDSKNKVQLRFSSKKYIQLWLLNCWYCEFFTWKKVEVVCLSFDRDIWDIYVDCGGGANLLHLFTLPIWICGTLTQIFFAWCVIFVDHSLVASCIFEIMYKLYIIAWLDLWNHTKAYNKITRVQEISISTREL